MKPSVIWIVSLLAMYGINDFTVMFKKLRIRINNLVILVIIVKGSR